MARFRPLYVRRSDGKAETIGKGKRRDPNQPTDDQLDQKPDKDGVSDFYREVAIDENKHLDWRRKLGGMLARELDWKESSGAVDHGYMLAAFPENYRLYEHVKRTERDGKLEVKNKTHAAGGNDRQDAYLYGHPDGRRKRFRSPGDFFPHLLWLATDESGDPDNCTCKICSPEELDSYTPTFKVKAEKSTKLDVDVKTSLPVQQDREPATTRQTIRQQSTQIKPEPQKVVPRQNATAQRQTGPSPLPMRRNQDQNVDSMYRLFLYRPGELVWFGRGQAWGLGVVMRRWATADRQHKYNVQPLSHPADNPELMLRSEAELRPWLAWSVPKFIAPGLNNLPNPARYESADWKGMSENRFGPGDMEVDASILAAKMIDSTYTPCHQENVVEIQPGVLELRYTCVFLGAEKIWVGDPVRLVIGSGADIMVVHAIIERKRKFSPDNSNSAAPFPPNLSFVGDIYTLTTVSHSDPNIATPAAPNNNPHLPQRLTEDLAFRNARSIPARREANYWHLVSASASINALQAVKGRWYEASIMLPWLLPEAEFTAAATKGTIQEAGLWMNSRGDCINSNRDAHLPRLPAENVRRDTRELAFDRAVPLESRVLEGFEPPPANETNETAPAGGRRAVESVRRQEVSGAPQSSSSSMEIDPRFDTADTAGGHVTTAGAGAGAGLDEFMNLDEMDTGYGQTFDGHTGTDRRPYF